MAKTKQYEKPKQEEKERPVVDLDISAEAIELVKQEWKSYENALVFVTDKVAFNIRALVKTLRQNYWGIFDNPYDPISGEKLTWVPITEWTVDVNTTNADQDQKDIRVRAKGSSYVGLAMFVRNLVQNWMSDNIFGEDIDETERQLMIDGSHIWKIYESYDENGKKCTKRTSVDILNAYFDFTVKSIQDAPRFTERGLMYPSDVESMDGWINTKGIVGTTSLHPTDTNLTAATAPGQPQGARQIDVWESWGKYPKYLMTGKREDTEQVNLHIVVSGLQGKADNARCHLIETYKGKKPYEEGHTKRVQGRWLGRGPAESVMMIQGWLNMIVNIRKIRHKFTQLGIFKVKKQAGVSPQKISKMVANGVIEVNSMDDVEQMVMQEASASSYQDETNAIGWAQRITSAWDSVTGEPSPASKPATSVVIESKAAGKSTTMYKKAFGFFLTRVMNNHILPMLMSQVTPGQVVELSGSPEELAAFDDAIVNALAEQQIADELDKAKKEGRKIYYDKDQVFAEIERVKGEMKRLGKQRFSALGEVDITKYKVEIYVGDEEFDADKAANNLLAMLKVVPEYRMQIARQLYDLMEFDSSKLDAAATQAQQQPTQPQPEPVA